MMTNKEAVDKLREAVSFAFLSGKLTFSHCAELHNAIIFYNPPEPSVVKPERTPVVMYRMETPIDEHTPDVCKRDQGRVVGTPITHDYDLAVEKPIEMGGGMSFVCLLFAVAVIGTMIYLISLAF